MKYISYIEIVVGMGLAMGPAIGSVFDSFTGYENTMYIFGVINTVAMLSCWWYLPNELNKTQSEAEVAELEAEVANLIDEDVDPKSKSKKSKVTWLTVLKNREFSFALVTCFFGTINLVYF